MSDLISTPSQSQSTVSTDTFEALIDLLASDGDDDDDASGEAKPSLSLRDPSGKLDFDKIRKMFAAHNGRHVANAQDSDDVPSTSRAQTLPRERPSAGHRRSSTFGIQWAEMDENPAKEDAGAPTLASLDQPLALDELNAALADAQQDVRSLRQQYDQLESVVSDRLGSQVKRAVMTDKAEHGDEKDSQAPPGAIMPMALGPSDVPTQIARLSETEVRRALTTLACSLNLSLDAIGILAGLSPQLGSLPLNPARQHDVASIARALNFLGKVDELVWRRTSAPSGPRTLQPVFSEGNVVALVARLELWERAVRRSSRI